VVSVFFYLRIVVMMYMTDRDARPVPAPVSGLAMGGLVLAMLGVLYLGVLPTRLIEFAQQSIGTIF
jgi:NADH-quinone oxidoreductase subunit N